MLIRRRPTLCAAILLALSVVGCGGSSSSSSSSESREVYPGRPADAAGLVTPVKTDVTADIVSWVDGQVVTDWAAERDKRERAIDAYLNDADAGHAEKYGFRSGQNPR